MERRSKLGLTIAASGFSAGILHAHAVGSLSPGLPLGTTIATVGLLVLVWSEQLSISLSAIVTLGALYRVVAFAIPPTLLNFDPDAHAVRSQIVLQTGSTKDLVGVFYGTAAAFDVHGAQIALLTGLPIDDAYVFYPLAIGVGIPLLALLAVNVLFRSIDLPTHSKRIGLGCAAILAVVEATTIQYGAAPVPVAYSALFLAAIVFTIVSFLPHRTWEFLTVLALFSAALLTSAKVPLLLFVAILSVWVVVDSVTSTQHPSPRQTPLTFTLLFGVLLALQWMYITEFFSFGAGALAVLTKLVIGEAATRTPPAATPYSKGLLEKLLGLSNILSLLVAGGIAWLYIAATRLSNESVKPLLAASAVTVAFIIPNLVFGSGPGFQRVFVYAVPFVCALIPTALLLALNDNHPRLPIPYIPQGSAIVCGAIFLLVIANLGSMGATPDRVGGHRFYLTQSEVEGKHFTNAHISDNVYMDMYYGDEVVNFQRAARGPEYHQYTVPHSWGRPLLSQELLTRNLIAQQYSYVAYRPTVDVYRLSGGRYRLMWDPGNVLDKHYYKVYSSGGSNIYRRPQ